MNSVFMELEHLYEFYLYDLEHLHEFIIFVWFRL